VDPFEQFKQTQKKGWSTFGQNELQTCMPAARLVAFAKPKAGQRVLDVACGTGVVAIAAARTGAQVTGLDLTPELIARARENSAITGDAIDWHEGDAEALPFPDASFDMVLSQFGHMFAPRPEVVTREMLRVLKPGGTIAFATWPPEMYSGRMFALVGKYLPPPPEGVAPPALWGSPDVVSERLGNAVTDVVFDRGVLRTPGFGPRHMRVYFESSGASVTRAVKHLSDQPEKLETLRNEVEALIAEYFDPAENVLRQDYLLTRARKV